MKTRRDARIFVYRAIVVPSLRKKAAAIKAMDIGPEVTSTGLKRVRLEMVALADWLEAKAAKLDKPKEGP